MPGETCRKSSCCTKPDCSPWTCPLLPSLPPCTVPALTSLFLPVLLDESQTQRLKVSSHGGPSFFSPFSRQIINFRLPDSRADSPPPLPAGIPPEARAGSPVLLRDPMPQSPCCPDHAGSSTDGEDSGWPGRCTHPEAGPREAAPGPSRSLRLG